MPPNTKQTAGGADLNHPEGRTPLLCKLQQDYLAWGAGGAWKAERGVLAYLLGSPVLGGSQRAGKLNLSPDKMSDLLVESNLILGSGIT